MAHQSLYRRYRPRRFVEVRGQEHVVRALRNSVRTGTEGHAYLFSGPRGTGKTSTARILAKALNCEDLHDGEPCCECSSCVEMEAGRSFDLFELDAASNNGVDSIRDLVERAAVASPGRTKMYILDEVHMLTAGASNALLKTLEEPPEHVCFVLATTDPQKVLPTIRSRTQHYDFQLLSAAELTDYVRWIAADAPLDVDDESVAYVVREGHGSARDTLSALDQVVAAGGVITRELPVDQLLGAIAAGDSGAAVLAVSDALALGHDPRVLAESFLAELRDAFLLSLGVEVTHLVDADAERLGEWARTLGTPVLTRAVEAVGSALVDMRQAADPRVPLDVAMVRLCVGAPTAGGAAGPAPAGRGSGDEAVVADLVRRVEALERALADGAVAGGGGGGGGAGAGGGARSRRAAAAPERTAASGPPPADADAGEGSSNAGSDAASATGSGSRSGPEHARAALAEMRARRSGADSKGDRSPARPGPSAPASPGPAPSVAPRPSARSAAAPEAPEAPAASAVPSSPPPRPAAEKDPTPSANPETTAADRSLPPAPPSDSVAVTAGSATLDRDGLTVVFGDRVVPQLKGVAKAIYASGHFVAVTGRGVVFTLPNAATVERAEKFRPDVESMIGAEVGSPVRLLLVDETDPAAVADATGEPGRSAASSTPASTPTPPPPRGRTAPPTRSEEPAVAVPEPTTAPDPVEPTGDDDESSIIDVHDLEDADVAASGVEKLTQAFPGAVLVDGADGAS
ncbi:MAG TPA: DNA polymerase III subunit gamma/tau [Microthrixaceae bacterium]|nr:DNA polymerase III subunit gamma/tau [Microthrixaceae bacterium]